jgi:hypothetical protein
MRSMTPGSAGRWGIVKAVALLAALTALGAACSTTTVIVIHEAPNAVVVIRPDGGTPYGTVKPTALTRLDAGLDHLAWTKWSATAAVGHGTILVNAQTVPVTLRFSQVIDHQFTDLTEIYDGTSNPVQGAGYTGSQGGTKTTAPPASGPILVIQVVYPPSTYGVIQPTGLASGPSQTGRIVNLTWSSWSESGAVGHGMVEGDDCLPNCAEGKISYSPEVLTLSDAVQGRYTRITVQANGQTNSLTGQEVSDFFEGSSGGIIVPIGSASSTTTTEPSPTPTTVPVPTTVPTSPSTSTSTSTSTPGSPITIASLETAAATQAGLGAGTTATCGPAPTGLGVGAYVACGLFNASVGGAEEVVQITGPSPTSFTVVVGPGSDIGCSGVNAGEKAAMIAHGGTCDPGD